jgi:C1A family cysteine protease
MTKNTVWLLALATLLGLVVGVVLSCGGGGNNGGDDNAASDDASNDEAADTQPNASVPQSAAEAATGIITEQERRWLTEESANPCAIDLDEIQQAIERNHAPWQAADNHLLHKSCSELRGLLGARKPTVSPGDNFFQASETKSFPASFDWRNHGGNFITPVRDQLDCGSCWAFAAAASTEANYAIANNIPNPTMDLSEQTLVSCSGAGDCIWGGWTEDAYTYIQDTGIPDEACFPYSAYDESCYDRCGNWASRVTKIYQWSWVTEGSADVNTIKAALLEGPVTTNFDVYDDFFAYAGGVYTHVWGYYEGAHAVMIVGWNNSDQSWIVKNSWGASWGGPDPGYGYFKIRWGQVSFGMYSSLATVCSGCIIGGACYANGTPKPGNPCQSCDISQSQTAWSNNTAACDDGNLCNGADTCSGGSCSVHANPPNCDDGNVCTDDSCVPATGCKHTNNTDSCTDGNLCNGTDSCSGGSCSVHTNPLNCDDGNGCTDDSCVPASGCQHTNNTASCDDGLFCTGLDTCSAGNCSEHAGDPCAPDTTCDESADTCVQNIDDDTTIDDDATPDDDTPTDDDTSPSDDDTTPGDDDATDDDNGGGGGGGGCGC